VEVVHGVYPRYSPVGSTVKKKGTHGQRHFRVQTDIRNGSIVGEDRQGDEVRGIHEHEVRV